MTEGSDTMTTRSPEREEFLKDVLITAVEGGINYWASVSDYDPDAGTVTVWEEEEPDGEGFAVDLDVIARGIGLLLDNSDKLRVQGYPDWSQFRLANRTNGDDGDFDADVADLVMQLGVFGEVVYG